jgi:hypothetical protein
MMLALMCFIAGRPEENDVSLIAKSVAAFCCAFVDR